MIQLTTTPRSSRILLIQELSERKGVEKSLSLGSGS
jgi:hypothetical protein